MDGKRHPAEDNLISPQKENMATQQACPPETIPPESAARNLHWSYLTSMKKDGAVKRI